MKLATAISSVALMAAPMIVLPAYADDYGSTASDADVFVGGSAIYSKLDNLEIRDNAVDEGELGEFDDDRSSWKAFAGVWANDWLGIEAQYLDMGKYEDNGFSLDADGYTASLLLGMPLGDHSRIFVKGGRLWWNADTTGPLGYDSSADGSTLFYGAGVSLGLLENVNLRAEYERARFDEDNVDADLDFASVGVGFMF